MSDSPNGDNDELERVISMQTSESNGNATPQLSLDDNSDVESNGNQDGQNGPVRKRRRLRRGHESTENISRPARSDISLQRHNNTGLDDGNYSPIHSDEAEELEDDIIDELDIQRQEAQYFSQDEEDDDEGEDLVENAAMDYRPMETLDRYDPTVLDNRDYEEMDFDTRMLVEAELNRRDNREGRVTQLLDEDNEAELDTTHRDRRLRLNQNRSQDGSMNIGNVLENHSVVNLEHFDVPLREWIASERPRMEIKRRFIDFLDTFEKDYDRNVNQQQKKKHYHEKIIAMAQRNEGFLEIEIGDIIQNMSMIAAWIVEQPKQMLEILSDATTEFVKILFPYYDAIKSSQISVRILDLPGTEKIRDLRTAHLDFLIKVTGVITRRTGVFPQLRLVKVNCPSCGAVLGPFTQHSHTEVKCNSCPECHYQGKNSFPTNHEFTVYQNYQKLTLQESPGSVPPGRVPRAKDVILTGELIDSARPGDECAITGIYVNSPDPRMNIKQGFPVFRTVIEANHVEVVGSGKSGSSMLSAADKKKILSLSKNPQIAEILIQSIAPSIFGHHHVKTAICLALFGGKPKYIKNSRVRGDLNILLVGDPGTAKSQFLKFIQKTAPRAVYSTGKGASAVGLTAGVARDPFTKEWVLQGGALVLADKGVCLIDEFDKMSEMDRTSIHEAMEQQSISVSKAGIVTSLQARCSVIAAANPIGGRYNSGLTFAENVELTDPILQRFDILCVLQDNVDPLEDTRLADFVISSHMNSIPINQKGAKRRKKRTSANDTANTSQNRSVPNGFDQSELLDHEMLRKYILYARTYVNPVMNAQTLDTRKVETFYATLRKASQHTGAVPIAVRHIESLFRMSEAYARLHLRDSVQNEDIDFAISVLTEALCNAQKASFRRQWRRLFRPYLTFRQDNNALLHHILAECFQSARMYAQLKNRTESRQNRKNITTETYTVLMSEFREKAKQMGILDIGQYLQSDSFQNDGYHIDNENGIIVKAV